MATQQAKYLFKKRGVYYFERRVPAELSAHYSSPKIVKSLKTKNVRRANKLARQLADRLDDHWALLRGDLFSRIIADHKAYMAEMQVEQPSISIQDALLEYLRLKGQGKSDRFRRYAERSVGYLLEFVGSKNLSEYNRADANTLRDALIDRGLVFPGLDYVLKCSHSFNLLDARGVIAVAERTRYIGRIRNLAREVANLYLQQRERLNFPLQKS